MSAYETLKEKYWNAETTANEEKQLKALIEAGNITDLTDEEISYFNLLKTNSNIKAPELSWPEEMLNTKSKKTKTIFLTPMLRNIAAVCVLALGMVFLVKQNLSTTPKANVIEVEDPEMALEYTKQAFALLSKNYNKGTENIKTGMGEISKLNIVK